MNICSSACEDPVIKVIKSHASAHKWIFSGSHERGFSTHTPRTAQLVWRARQVTSEASGFGHRWRQEAGFDELVV